MNLALIAVGLLSLALPGLTGSAGRRLAPDEWARLTAASLRTGLGALRAGLLLTALATVGHASGLAHIADVCHHVVGTVAPGPSGAIAGAAFAVVEVRLGLARRRGRRAERRLRVEPWLGSHSPRGDHEVVVVPTGRAVAYAAPGGPPQVVVSQGLVDRLSAAELAAVVRHELCHLAHGHQRQLARAARLDAALGFLPGVRRSTATLRLALERWADEAADDRIAVRSALTKMVRSLLAAPVVAPAFTAADTVRARLVALADRPASVPAAPWRWAIAAPTLALAALVPAAIALSPAVHHPLLTLLDRCLG